MGRRGPASPYLVFDRAEWAALRANARLDLADADLAALRGLNDRLSLADVADIHLPLSRLINLQVRAARHLGSLVEGAFLGRPSASTPYVIGVAGSVAVGKSTFARVLQAALSRWPEHPRVDLVTTDGFLRPTRVLEARGLMHRKGFPETYDLKRMLRFLTDLKSGVPGLRAPVYSAELYDVVPGGFQTIDRPDILIFEGLNVLQTVAGAPVVASDFFDFSIYLDAETAMIEDWYVDRFLLLRRTAFQSPTSYFHHYADLPEDKARSVARDIWRRINLPNLTDNIQPTRGRARLVMRMGRSHAVEEVWLRRR
ncbi:MAG TPA: type I pantothenate kinase [Roseomonas sp.]|jgi:type I pantothenate kinase